MASLIDINEKEHSRGCPEGAVGGRFSYKTLSIKVKYRSFITHTRAHPLEHFTGDINAIKDTSKSLLKEFLDGKKIRLISIRLSNLEKVKARQKSMEEFLLA